MNMQALMAQAQKMQRDITKKKEEIDNMEFEGNSELVNITMSGKKEVLQVNIKCEGTLDSDDVEALEDMINDSYLGLCVVALGLVIWLIVLFIKDPKDILRKKLMKN